VLGGQRVADTAFDFHSEHECVQKLRAGYGPVLGNGANRRGERDGGVNHRFHVGVVEIEDVRGHRIHERCVQGIELFATADDGRGALARQGR
jgi:hypothetical protein